MVNKNGEKRGLSSLSTTRVPYVLEKKTECRAGSLALIIYIFICSKAVANLADNMIGVIKSSFAISYKFL
jgi:hypothetical protein